MDARERKRISILNNGASAPLKNDTNKNTTKQRTDEK